MDEIHLWRYEKMLKGINRHVIEVTNTDNIYYERAILIVRPEFTSEEKRILEKEARKMLKEMNAPAIIKTKKQVLKKILFMLVPAAAGVLITLLVTNILQVG